MPIALIVEDDRNSRDGLAEWAGAEGFDVRTAATLKEARRHLGEGVVDVVIVDLQLPDGNGLELVQELESLPQVEVLILTGHGTVDSAVEAIKRGAVDYITKPADLKRLAKALAHIREKLELREQVIEMRGQLRQLGRFGCMIGASPAMQQVYDLVTRVAPTDASVLVTGETGVGKELVARMVHELSRRSKKTFVPINCGAVAPNLIESELFGHEKGSFTGADRQHKGIFERADGGSLLLDEVTEMPTDLQVKLLRVLETGTLTRIGGDKLEQVDVRIVGATNQDPDGAVTAGRLRRDLLYRLNVFPIHVPPLRERGGDVELLARHFLNELNRSAGTSKALTDAALARLVAHDWPGNVRELKNVVERAFIMAPGRIDAEHVPLGDRPVATGGNGDGEASLQFSVGTSVADAERRLILATLEQVQGNKREAARLLGLSLKTLYNRLKDYSRA